MEDAEAIRAMSALIKGPHPLDALRRFARRVPAPWRDDPPERWFEWIRCMLETTQEQIARRSGLDQSVVSRLEGGFDARLSSWRRAYAALGFDLVLLPVADLPFRKLRELADEDRATTRMSRQHARPRRRRMKEHAARLAAATGGAPPASASTAPSGTPPGPSSPPR